MNIQFSDMYYSYVKPVDDFHPQASRRTSTLDLQIQPNPSCVPPPWS